MRALPIVFASGLAVTAASVGPVSAAASDSATATLAVTAHFNSRTSLKVSASQLHFAVDDPDRAAVAAVEFSAGARTGEGAEVVLSVEPLGPVGGPGGAADVETAITFGGEGEGVLSGTLGASAPSVAGRWIGSGLRTGRLVFSLRAGAGHYSLPVRFVLSAP
jgi:hypothetical protein